MRVDRGIIQLFEGLSIDEVFNPAFEEQWFWDLSTELGDMGIKRQLFVKENPQQVKIFFLALIINDIAQEIIGPRILPWRKEMSKLSSSESLPFISVFWVRPAR